MNKTLKFLIGCLGTRLMLTFLAKYVGQKNREKIAYITMFISVTFITLYLFDLRKTGAEAEGLIWWNKLRPIHGVMYFLFSIYTFKKEKFSWIFLLIDTILGFIFWYLKYYKDLILFKSTFFITRGIYSIMKFFKMFNHLVI